MKRYMIGLRNINEPPELIPESDGALVLHADLAQLAGRVRAVVDELDGVPETQDVRTELSAIAGEMSK